MARPVTYGSRMRVYLTPEHLSAIRREAVLTGVMPSDVVRAALAAYFNAPDPQEATKPAAKKAAKRKGRS